MISESEAPSTDSWHLRETYKSMIAISVSCMKILVLVNGGAAVAVLTYLGNLTAHMTTAPQIYIVPAILWYCGGLMAAVVAFILSYLVQLQLYSEERALHNGQTVRRKHQWLLWAAIVLCIFSATAFATGCIRAALAFNAATACPSIDAPG